jgi:hypothetical protein
MSYFINPVGEDRCVFLSYEGEMPAVELSAARYEADAVLDQRRWHRLVVDVTQLQSVPTVPELFDFASELEIRSSFFRSPRGRSVFPPHFSGFSTCPPNWKRIADNSLSWKSASPRELNRA